MAGAYSLVMRGRGEDGGADEERGFKINVSKSSINILQILFHYPSANTKNNMIYESHLFLLLLGIRCDQ